jgi:hypothetical protein
MTWNAIGMGEEEEHPAYCCNFRRCSEGVAEVIFCNMINVLMFICDDSGRVQVC